MRFTAMSCSRQASTVSSGSPFFRASFALCSMWVTVCGMKRNLKKSTIVGLGGIAASAARSSGKPLGVRPPNRTPVPRRSLGAWAGAADTWSCFIMLSSSASARSSEVLRSTSMNRSSQYRATVCRAGSGVNEQLLRLDLGQLHVALPALGVALHERLHLFGRTWERVEGRARKELPRAFGSRDLVEPAGELVHDGLGRARRDHDAPPGRDIGAAVAELGERRHIGECRRALRGGGRKNAQFSG